MTLARPLAALTTVSTTIARSRSVSRDTSPVTPSAVMPWTPARTINSTTLVWLSRSMSPLAVKAVGNTENTPPNVTHSPCRVSPYSLRSASVWRARTRVNTYHGVLGRVVYNVSRNRRRHVRGAPGGRVRVIQPLLRIGLAACVGAIAVIAVDAGQAPGIASPTGEWRTYGGDLANTRYSPLASIARDNVASLKVAWRWRSDNFSTPPEYRNESTPLMIGGTLYFTSGASRWVVAADAVTGATKWTWHLDEGERGRHAPRRDSGRGVAYWSDGRGGRASSPSRPASISSRSTPRPDCPSRPSAIAASSI